MKNSTTKLALLASTLFVLFLIAGNSTLGIGLSPFQKPAVNTGREAQAQATSYRLYVPHINQNVSRTELQPTVTPQTKAVSVQMVSAPAVLSDRVGEGREADPNQTAAPKVQAVSPALQAWIDQVSDGEAGVVRGLFVEGVMALRVVQQPANSWQYVSVDPETATQFQSTAPAITGLLAHNYLAGKLFYNLSKDQEIVAIYGDKKIDRYRVTEIHKYQKLDEDNYYSPFIDLDNGEKLSSTQVFNRVYSGSKHLTLQTCLEKDGNWSWGLAFIVATPED